MVVFAMNQSASSHCYNFASMQYLMLLFYPIPVVTSCGLDPLVQQSGSENPWQSSMQKRFRHSCCNFDESTYARAMESKDAVVWERCVLALGI